MEEILIKCSLFKGLNSSSLEKAFAGTSYQLKKYNKDEIIAYADTELTSLLILLEGTVRGEMMDFSGKTIKIEDIESPNVLAPAFLFGSNNKFPVSILANNSVQVLFIQKISVIKLLQKNGVILSNYLDNISSRAQFLSNKIRFLSFQTIKGKIAHFLLQLAKKTGNNSFNLPKSQNELAVMFAVTRPALGRAIRELDKEEIIAANGKKIEILDKEKLSGLLR